MADTHILEVYQKVENLQLNMIIYERHLIIYTSRNLKGAPKKQSKTKGYSSNVQNHWGCLDWLILSSFWLLAPFYFGGVWERLNAFKHLLLGEKGTEVI